MGEKTRPEGFVCYLTEEVASNEGLSAYTSEKVKWQRFVVGTVGTFRDFSLNSRLCNGSHHQRHPVIADFASYDGLELLVAEMIVLYPLGTVWINRQNYAFQHMTPS